MTATAIPHALSEHEQRVDRAKLGMWMFLGSEVMFFTGFLAAYIALRMSDPAWPRGHQVLNWRLAAVNTVVLITSSLTMALAVNAAQRNLRGRLRGCLALTILLAVTFLVIKGFEYAHKIHDGHTPGSHLFYGTYFLLTGFHGLHVLGGIVALTLVLLLSKRFDSRWNAPVENVGLYWHFVDIVWIFLFPTLYLL
ncbi:MAG TPA: cytochrome c oxidase subunit 3 family protein [Planctomycetota bacterium]|jgi:heme/copper-type cytochrome/quinol oxidase subunit 3|nr:cytochrome c oxidase subunit 3 family protein [Planctomycetota bacterium]